MMITKIKGLAKINRCSFASAVAQLTDWQYVNKIQNSIKQSNINQALRYLVNSHLNGQVLDMHVFRNLYMKIHQTKAGISYEQIVYKLYREHFKPHTLMLDWMNSLARSSNPNIINLLKKDYHLLKLEMPNVQKIKQQDQDNGTILKLGSAKKTQLSSIAPAAVTKHSPNPHTKIMRSPNVEKGLKPILENSNEHPIIKMDESVLGQENINQLILNVLGNKPNIVIHNVEVVYNNFDEDFQEDHATEGHNLNHNFEKEFNNSDKQQDDEQVGQFQYVKKIKIGKIQIITNKNNDPDQPDSPILGNPPK